MQVSSIEINEYEILLSVVRKDGIRVLSIKNYFYWYMDTCFEEFCNAIGKFRCCSTT